MKPNTLVGQMLTRTLHQLARVYSFGFWEHSFVLIIGYVHWGTMWLMNARIVLQYDAIVFGHQHKGWFGHEH